MALKLSERLAKYRTEGHLIDEWVNDELVREAQRLEAEVEKFTSINSAMVPCSEIEKILNDKESTMVGRIIDIKALVAQHQ